MFKKIQKANEIDEDNIEIIFQDDEIIQIQISSQNNNQKYLITKNEYDYWRCDCPDYLRHNSREGSYICKHILKVLYYLNKQENNTKTPQSPNNYNNNWNNLKNQLKK